MKGKPDLFSETQEPCSNISVCEVNGHPSTRGSSFPVTV